jgi:polyhydroxybutyrate depolymerase
MAVSGDALGSGGASERHDPGPAGRLAEAISRPTPVVAAVAATGAAAIWMAVLAAEVKRTGLAHSLVSRPDRILGWDGAAFWAPLTLATAVAALLVVVAALGSRAAVRGRATWAALVALLAVAALGQLAVQLFTPDANMYETSPLRGLGAWALVLAAPAAAAVAGIGLLRAGSTVVGWASLAVGLLLVWVAVDVAGWGAVAGAVQPQVEASIGVEIVLAGWLVGLSGVLVALRGRPSVTGIGSWRGRIALGGVGAFASVIVGVQMVVSLLSYSYLGPVVMTQLAGATRDETIVVDGITRSYRIHMPPRGWTEGAGLMIALSGVFGDGFQAELTTGLDAEADRLHWIAVYPDSVLDGWMAYGNDDSWGHHPGADDIPFLRALIDQEISRDYVDPGRIFVTGMSRGGMMTHRVGCELADKVAAIAPVSGNMATTSGSAFDVPCHPSRPVSVLAIHGTADGVIPFSGGHVDIDYAPFNEVMAKWRTIDGCSGDGIRTIEGSSTTTAWSCSGGTIVAQRVVEGGWHQWPGSPGAHGPDAFDAARVIADFFVAHSRD